MYRYFEINAGSSNIRCKLYCREKGVHEKAIVFCTGFAGHKDNMAAYRFAEKVLSKKDVMVVVFNWPAHGDDVKKKLSLDDCSTYLELVIREMKESYGASELTCYATSFGGYLVLKYIKEHGNPFRKVALRCPAVDMYDVFSSSIMENDEYDRIMKGKEVKVGFDRKLIITRSFLEDLKANDIRHWDFLDYADDILILHGTADEIVPFESSKSFAEDNVIEFIPIEGADHRFQNPAHMSLATKYVMEFFFDSQV